MIRTQQIVSLTDFKKETNEFVRRLRKSGRPGVLTVNGKAAVIVMDPVAYDRFLDAIDEADSASSVRRGLREIEEGKGIPAEQAFGRARVKRKAS